jgi:hypothetical protein
MIIIALLRDHDLLSQQLNASRLKAILPMPLFSSQIQLPNSTMQKEDSHHIKMAAHVWSTKYR